MNSYIPGCLELKNTTRLGGWSHMFLKVIEFGCLWEKLEMQKFIKRWKSIFFPSDYKQKEVGAPGHKATMDWCCLSFHSTMSNVSPSSSRSCHHLKYSWSYSQTHMPSRQKAQRERWRAKRLPEVPSNGCFFQLEIIAPQINFIGYDAATTQSSIVASYILLFLICKGI